MALDRFDCYELCVQSPRHVAAFLRGVHGNEPVVLRDRRRQSPRPTEPVIA